MINFLLSLPTWIGCVLAVSFTAVVGMAVYLIFYKLISTYQRHDLKDPVSSLFRVVGMLVSLMLALAFSDVIIELRTIRNSLQREAASISDLFEVMKVYEMAGTREIRTILVDYAQAIIDDDWPALADDRLGKRTEALRKQLAEAVISLEPATPKQERLLSYIYSDIDLLSDFRVIRLDTALATPPIYIYAIVFGFVVTMACFGAYKPQVPLVVLVLLYTIFVGLVLYLVLALSDPFQGNIGVAPTSFEYLIETMQTKIK